VMAAKDILSPEEIDLMALRVVENGGYISYKDNGDGTSSPYELNTTWFSALNNADSDEPHALQVDRYLASRAIALVIKGVPGVYFHGLFGTKNDAELVIEQKSTRSINRKNIEKKEFIESLERKTDHTAIIAQRLMQLIRVRKQQKAFHPNAEQRVIDTNTHLFVVFRSRKMYNEYILAIVNVTAENQILELSSDTLSISYTSARDLLTQTEYEMIKGKLTLELEPYQISWLKWF